MGLGDISADVDIIENACTMESIVDELLLEIGDAFELHKEQQEARTNTNISPYLIMEEHGLLCQTQCMYMR